MANRPRLVICSAIAAALVLFGALALNVAALTKPQARVLARALNLMASDVPGFAATPISPPVFSKTGRCPGEVSPSRWLAFAHSDAFEQGSGSSFLAVSSAAVVLPSAQLAKRDIAALRGKRGRQCFANAVRRSLTGSGFKLLHLKVTSRPGPTPDGVGLRIALRLSKSGTVFTEYADALIFVRRQVSVALDTAGISRPFPAALERRLSRVLVARAKRKVP